MKKPILAALLNLIPGAGYLYVGTRKPFAALLLLSTIIGSIPFFVFFESYKVDDPWILASSTILQIALMVDAYMLAKEQNKSAAKK